MTETKGKMRERRRCQYCHQEIPHYKRPDARFCDESCRSKYWKYRKEWEKFSEELERVLMIFITSMPKKKPGFFRRIWRKVFPPLSFFNFLQ